MEYVPDLVIAGGYVWAGLMFASAALNLFLALQTSILVWGSVMSVWESPARRRCSCCNTAICALWAAAATWRA